MKQSKKNRKKMRAAEKDAVKPVEEAKNVEEIKEEAAAPEAPRSWKQYIDETMPAQAAREEKPAEPAPQAERKQAVSADAVKGKLAALADWAGERAKAAAEAVRERAGSRRKAGRAVSKVRNVVARHPVSPLLYATVLAVAIGVVAFRSTYIRAYAMEVNGETVALVTGEDEVEAIQTNLESRVASILGESYDYDAEITLTPVYTVPDALSDAAEVEETLFDGVGAYMTAYGIAVDGVELGYAADKADLYRMLDEIAEPYIPEHTVRYDFVEDVQIYPVELPSNTKFDLEPIRETLSALEIEEATYEVKKGDTFNAIAYSLGMWPNELSILNPDIIVDKLWVGQELVIQQAVPYLSVQAVTDETYEEVIPSPVEYIETADLYVGDTKVKEQGEDGLALVNANVTYVNNVEVEREVITSTTLEEATTTYTYTGTTPRPLTASNGYYIWPVRGTITSNFGGRYLGGYYDFHLGLDIAVPYGTAIKAADGGTVIKAGWNGSYGILVAIRHDNGTVTYYGHNSSVLVSVGDKVYQGQIIARAGSTGNSTGNHCHFEVRVNGTSVNPRNYLP